MSKDQRASVVNNRRITRSNRNSKKDHNFEIEGSEAEIQEGTQRSTYLDLEDNIVAVEKGISSQNADNEQVWGGSISGSWERWACLGAAKEEEGEM